MNEHDGIDDSTREQARRFAETNDPDGAMRWRLEQARDLLVDLGNLLGDYDPTRRTQPSTWDQVADVVYVIEQLGGAARHLGVFTSEDEARRALGLTQSRSARVPPRR